MSQEVADAYSIALSAAVAFSEREGSGGHPQSQTVATPALVAVPYGTATMRNIIFRIVESEAGLRQARLANSRLPRDISDVSSTEDIVRIAQQYRQAEARTGASVNDSDDE